MNTFWKPKQVKPIKNNLGLKLKAYPKRTKQELKLIDNRPYMDADKDKVMNWFDCRPLSKRWQDVLLYHGTSKHAARKIKKEGLKRQHAITGHVFLTSKKHIAQRYAGEEGTVLAVRLPEELVRESTGGPIHPEATTQVMIQEDIHPRRIRELKAAEEGYPTRTKKELELVDQHPWEDTDKDGVLNYFDCKPLDKTKQGWTKLSPKGSWVWRPTREEARKAYQKLREAGIPVSIAMRVRHWRPTKMQNVIEGKSMAFDIASEKEREKRTGYKTPEYLRAQLKKWRDSPRGKLYAVKYREENRAEQKKRMKKWRARPEVQARIKEYRKLWDSKNAELKKPVAHTQKYTYVSKEKRHKMMYDMPITEKVLEENLKAVEEGKPLTVPLRLLRGKLGEKYPQVHKRIGTPQVPGQALTDIHSIRTTVEKKKWLEEHSLQPGLVFREALDKLIEQEGKKNKLEIGPMALIETREQKLERLREEVKEFEPDIELKEKEESYEPAEPGEYTLEIESAEPFEPSPYEIGGYSPEDFEEKAEEKK